MGWPDVSPTETTITLPAAAGELERFAATELQRYPAALFGAEAAITTSRPPSSLSVWGGVRPPQERGDPPGRWHFTLAVDSALDDQALALLRTGEWDASASAEAITREQATRVCGPEAAPPLVEASGIVERITRDFDSHVIGFGFR